MIYHKKIAVLVSLFFASMTSCSQAMEKIWTIPCLTTNDCFNIKDNGLRFRNVFGLSTTLRKASSIFKQNERRDNTIALPKFHRTVYTSSWGNWQPKNEIEDSQFIAKKRN